MANKKRRKLNSRAFKKMLRMRAAAMSKIRAAAAKGLADANSEAVENVELKKAAQNQDGVNEPPQQLDPLERIFLFQSSNVETANLQAVEIKRECPDEFESNTNRLDLELDVECGPKTHKQQLHNLVIDNVNPEESSSSCKRSARIKMKEAVNQEKILQAIQAKNQRKENDQKEIEDGNVEDIEEEQDHNQEEEDQHEHNAEPADQLNLNYLPENEQQNQELEIKTEDQTEQQFEEIEHDESNKHNLEQLHKPTNSIENEKENKRHYNQKKVLQHEDLLIELERVPTVENTETKRKRGRPRKPLDATSSVVTEKRKRGRPRKSLDATPSVVTEKRKRGRPPKPRNDNNVVTTGKRKRGRPRKEDSVSQIVDIPVAPIQEEYEEESEDEYTVFISEEVMEDPIHLEIQGVINFLV
ncbi:hypothetical protein ABMA28_012795 [Loxostege sticticalis]|uniref:Uncharacterized protein n=1 Tax=Loxostege sticticalis TaxID=481309 RepID=A0ABD0S3P4_LOXSC